MYADLQLVFSALGEQHLIACGNIRGPDRADGQVITVEALIETVRLLAVRGRVHDHNSVAEGEPLAEKRYLREKANLHEDGLPWLRSGDNLGGKIRYSKIRFWLAKMIKL